MYAKTHPGLIVTIARVRGTVPLIILFKALGFITDKEIWETLLVRPEDGEFFDAMRSTMENKDSCSVKTQKEALIYIGTYRQKNSHDLLNIWSCSSCTF